MNIFIVVGIGFVVLSTVLWWAQPVNRTMTTGEPDGRAITRAVLLALWGAALPLYLVHLWNSEAPPTTTHALQLVQYRNKLMTDAWAAIAVVLGLLVGVKKYWLTSH